MKKYAIMCQQQALGIYKEDAQSVITNELKAVFNGMDESAEEISFEKIGGISYLTFKIQQEPSNAVFTRIARTSAFYALFEMKKEAFWPKEANPNYIFLQNMPALFNNQGKGNEFFTRLLINLALSACRTKSEGQKTLLDPLAGESTTLYDALMLGLNAYGVEISSKYFMDSCHYAAKFMQTAKFKHTTKTDKIFDIKSRKISDSYTLEFSADKKSFNSKQTSIFKIFAADTRSADKLLEKNAIDIIVSSLPRGIKQASKKASKKDEKSSKPVALFAEALPSWEMLLKKGGSIALSFNEHTTPKEKLAEIIQQSGMKVLNEAEYYGYQHIVDSTIRRNVIVAVKE